MNIKIYKDTNGNCVFDDGTVVLTPSQGTVSREIYADGKIKFKESSGSYLFDGHGFLISEIHDSSGVVYADLDTFKGATKDFFKKASSASLTFADEATVIAGTNETAPVNSRGVLAGFLNWVGSKTFAALPTSAKTMIDSITELWTNKVDDLGGTIYHSTPWFTPVAGQSVTISADGLTVTLSSGALFTSAMVGARIVVNGIRRVVGSYASTSVIGASSAFPASMRGITFTYDKWSIYPIVLTFTNGVINIFNKSLTPTVLIDNNSNYIVNSVYSLVKMLEPTVDIHLNNGVPFNLSNSSFIKYSSTSNGEVGGKDIGLKRNSAGILEINDGNTAGVYRDLNLRNLNYTGSLTNTSDIRLKQNIRPVTDGLKKVIDISKTIRHYEFIDQDAYGSGVITSEIAQYLLELGFDGHVKQRAPRNEDEGKLFGWEYEQREIVDQEGNPVLDTEGNKTFETVVAKEGDLIYTVDSQALTIYLFPAIVELNDKITAIEERLTNAGL